MNNTIGQTVVIIDHGPMPKLIFRQRYNLPILISSIAHKSQHNILEKYMLFFIKSSYYFYIVLDIIMS